MKRILSLGLAACMMAGLTACGSSQTETTAAADQETTTAAQTTVQESSAADGTPVQTEPLLVYLNDFDGVIGDLFKEATGYDVEVVVGNGAETMSRIEAEKSNPQWDVVWMDSMYDIYNLDLGGQLMTDVEIENASGLTPEFSALVPEDKCFYPTGAHSAGVLVYRNDVWSEEDAPKSYADLTDPKYAGAVAMADPGVAAPAYPLAAYFMDTLGMEGGQEFFTTLFEQGLKVYPKNPQVVEALASGEEQRTNLCVPGGAGCAVQIAGVLGVEAGSVEERVAVVCCGGTCEKTQPRMNYEGVHSCSAAKLLFGGAGACAFGCLGNGDCVSVCPQQAIRIDKGIAVVDRDACIGCGLCEKVCPNHVIGIFPKKQKVFDRCSNYNRGKAVMDVCKAGCIGCTKCSKVCPEGAITMDNCLAQVNPMKCTGCGTCVESCPTGCMSFTEKL